MYLLPQLGPGRVIYVLAAGLLLVVSALYLLIAGFPYIIALRIKSNIALNNGTEGMKSFEKLPVPLEFRIYLFNVTNPEEVTSGGRPVLAEIGPYIYDEYREKIDLQDSGEDTLTYQVKKTYFFNQAKSGLLRESDMVTVLNIPMLGTGFMIEERFPLGLAFLNSALPYLFPNSTSPFVRVTVGGLLFHGVPINCSYETGPAMPVCRGIKSNLPPPIRQIPGTGDFSFSMFQAVNGTPSKTFKVHRGNQDIYQLGKIVEYDNSSYLTMWDRNSSCAVLRGTDASILSPLREKEDLYLYLPEICLSLRAKFVKEAVAYGVHVYEYVPSADNFASPSEVEGNICRCKKVDGKKEPVCLKSGAIDASKCQGAPVILTPVHFLNSDPEYSGYPVGLSPDPAKHETRVLIEPKTGVPVSALKRIQMNLFLRRLEGIDLLKNVSEGLFPLVWVEEALTDEILTMILPSLQQLSKAGSIMDGIAWSVGAIGLVCLALGLALYAKHHNHLCFRQSNAVANISIAANPPQRKGGDFLSDRNTVYNVPITDNNRTNYYLNETFTERHGSFKNKDSVIPS